MSILKHGKLGFQMECQNPFVIAMHHIDNFPKGNGKLGPSELIDKGNSNEIDLNAPWRMYYGKEVPGFPAHPHRGFETVTVVTEGVVDHTDGLGSSGRYANGDVQWMTAGRGLEHCEMFPLVNTDKPNTMELFQIWLSLDKEHRMDRPDYKMLWREEIPVITQKNENASETKITLIAGEIDGIKAVGPTGSSWAADPKNHLSIQLIEIDKGSTYIIPAISSTLNRSIYFYDGDCIEVEEMGLNNEEYVFVSGDETTIVNNGNKTAKILLLEAEPIPERIIAHGPFVMSSEEEIRQAYVDYQNTRFGGWPFGDLEIYHSPDQVRYAKYSDGSVEYPEDVK